MVEIITIKGDITTITVDAIVNAANQSLLGGGGVDGAIHRAAGCELLEECKLLNGCQTGYAKITKGYKLPAKYVIHAVGPIWRGGNENEDNLLEGCYKNAIQLAVDNDCESISFPAISTGIYSFPLDRATKIAISTIQKYTKNTLIQKIVFVCFDDNTLQVYKQQFNNESFDVFSNNENKSVSEQQYSFLQNLFKIFKK